MTNTTDHPSRRAGLRDEIAAAIWERQNPGRRYADCEYRWKADAEADADAVLPVLYWEWPWLRAEAEDAASAVVPAADRVGGGRDSSASLEQAAANSRQPASDLNTADRAALRDRIAAAIWERQNPGRRWADCEYRWRADAEEDAEAVLSVLPAPADRAAVRAEAFDEAATAVAALDRRKTTIFADTIKDAWEEGRDDSAEAIHLLAVESAVVDRVAAETPPAETPDVDPVYDPRAWETYRRDVGCGCTAPAPVDCKIPHGTGAWLCVCHRLSGPPIKESDPPGKPLALSDEGIRKHFTEPNRCLSANGIFRCSRPTGHLGDHRTGRTFWGRRAEDDEQPGPAVVAQPGKDTETPQEA